MEKTIDKHHLCPSSRWWSNRAENLIKLDKRIHTALHLLFQNKLPHEQLLKLIEINKLVLTDTFIARIEGVCKNNRDIYKDKCFTNDL